MVPLALVGRWGSPAPINSPMAVVFGKPIEVPHKEHPTDAEVSAAEFGVLVVWGTLWL
jgi:hypothetical protein